METFAYRVLTSDCKPQLTYSPEGDLKIKKDELLSFIVKTSIAGFDLKQQEIELSTTSNLNISEEKLETSSDGTETFEVKGLDVGPGIITLTVSFKYYLETISAETQEEREYNEYGPMSKDEVNTIDVTVYDKPDVTTSTATEIKTTSATVGGNVTSDNFDQVTDRGVIFNETKMQAGSGIGPFSVNLTGLEPNTTYNVKAYATNSAGTVYGEMVSFTTPECEECTFIDEQDGQEYKCVEIGEQTWMAENLKATKYNDGTDIPLVTDNTEWGDLSTPGYCWYGNDAATYKTPYGALYNWHAVNTGKLCPTGWHVPTDAEWTTLTDYLGGEEVAGGKLKEAGTDHWRYPNVGATNSSGFTALGGGYRNYLHGIFRYVNFSGWWWSSTEFDYESDEEYAFVRYIFHDKDNINRYGFVPKSEGISVRCLRD